jgi:hypothetical protein
MVLPQGLGAQLPQQHWHLHRPVCCCQQQEQVQEQQERHRPGVGVNPVGLQLLVLHLLLWQVQLEACV